jgi:hypothetical protein
MSQESRASSGVKPGRVTPARVLVEDGQAPGGILEHELAARGYEVTVCRGPLAGHACALLKDGRCELAGTADVIYTRLDWEQRRCRRVLDALHARYSGTRIVIELPHGERWPAPHALDDCDLVWAPDAAATAVRVIDEVLGGPRQP